MKVNTRAAQIFYCFRGAAPAAGTAPPGALS